MFFPSSAQPACPHTLFPPEQGFQHPSALPGAALLPALGASTGARPALPHPHTAHRRFLRKTENIAPQAGHNCTCTESRCLASFTTPHAAPAGCERPCGRLLPLHVQPGVAGAGGLLPCKPQGTTGVPPSSPSPTAGPTPAAPGPAAPRPARGSRRLRPAPGSPAEPSRAGPIPSPRLTQKGSEASALHKLSIPMEPAALRFPPPHLAVPGRRHPSSTARHGSAQLSTAQLGPAPPRLGSAVTGMPSPGGAARPRCSAPPRPRAGGGKGGEGRGRAGKAEKPFQ